MKIRITQFICLIIITLSLAGCGSFTREVWLEEDGSGIASTTYDVASIFEMAGMMQGMMDTLMNVDFEDENETDDGLNDLKEPFDEDSENDGFSFLPDMSDMMKSGKFENIDSSFNMYDVMPDSIKEKLDNPELARQLEFSIKTSAENNSASISLRIHFEYPEQIKEIIGILSEIDSSELNIADQEKISDQFIDFIYDEKNAVVIVKADDLEDDELSEIGEEELEFLEEMFKDMKMVTIFHLPFDIKEVSLPGVTIEKRKIIHEISMLEMLKNNGIPEIKILMKKN